MKVYQLIYTAVNYSLSDSSLNLENKAGYKVYSCSQGLTTDEIEEIIQFCGYRKSENDSVQYSDEYASPDVPDLFPKTFRTFKLSSQKFVAVQIVYSGIDIYGNDGNFFAHAFVFDDVDDGFTPEQYYGSAAFRTHLTKKETELSLVRYLPVLTEIPTQENLPQWLDLFIKEHKTQLSYLIEKTVEILKGGEKTHFCVSADSGEESDYYLLALKRLLPRKLCEFSGISTNNTYLPSDNQNKILFNATTKGHNNITEEQIEARKNCIYVDFDNQNLSVVFERLFEMSYDELHMTYERLKIDSVEKFEVWLLSYNRVNEAGIGERLLKLKKIAPNLFVERSLELFSMLDNADMASVKFEILSIMHDNLIDFQDIASELTLKYTYTGFYGIVNGEPINMEGIFKCNEDNKELVDFVYNNLDEYMKILSGSELSGNQAMLILRIFAIFKQAAGFGTWKEFFKDNYDYMTFFVSLCADVIITDTTPVTFIAPIIWTNEELAEIVAYFDSSTDDADIKHGCRKFILSNIRENWEKFGISIIQKEKNREEREKDIAQIRKMLAIVGYVPFQRGKYQDLKFDVTNDINTNDNPLLLTRFLSAFYDWQMTEHEAEAKQYAMELYSLILEMREKEFSCYRFIFPKIALEMLSLSGLYHEVFINFETMEDTFWNWFLIGVRRNEDNEWIKQNYERVFKANEDDIKRLAIYPRLKQEFTKKEKRKGFIKMRNLKNTFMMVTLTAILLVSGVEALATDVPRKSEDKYGDETQKIVEIVTKDEEKTSDSSEETAKPTATPKSAATATPKATAIPKATAKATEKPSKTEKTENEDVENNTEKDEKEEREDKVIVVEEEPKPAVKVSGEKEQINSKRYLTKGGAFGMFLLTVLVSAVVSFLISYRFYKMNRLNSHIMAEIRALKRDIDTKMTGTVGGFSEYETRTTNSNPSYAQKGAAIRRSETETDTDSSSEMYSKWEPQLNTSRTEEQQAARRREYANRRSTSKRTKSASDGAAAIKGVINNFFNKKK